MSADPFDMMRQSVLAIQTQNELAAARVQIAALRKELAEAQENYHVTNSLAAKLQLENASLRLEVERLRKACELVFNESAKRKFLMCYKGDDFYVSLQAMEAMSEALGYSKAKEGRADA